MGLEASVLPSHVSQRETTTKENNVTSIIADLGFLNVHPKAYFVPEMTKTSNHTRK